MLRDELLKFNIRCLICFDQPNWKEEFTSEVTSFNLNYQIKSGLSCIIVTNQALKVSSVLNQLNNLNMKNVMIIGDECHHHNTDLSIEKLPKAVYRLGLSDNPYHHINEEHNININSFL